MLFIQTLWSNPVYFFSVCLIVTFSVCLHEYCHAWTGVREGDYTLQDHLTLNPVKQMGFMSLLMMAFIGIAWGSVPVNPTLLRGRWSMLKVSVAGPFANFVLFLAGGILLGISYRVPGLSETVKTPLLSFLFLFGVYNFVLLSFNLLPLPGMDGWHILVSFFPKLNVMSSEAVKGAMALIMLIAFMGGVMVLYNIGQKVILIIADLTVYVVSWLIPLIGGGA